MRLPPHGSLPIGFLSAALTALAPAAQGALITGVEAAASSEFTNDGRLAANAVNGAGLLAPVGHSEVPANQMWLSGQNDTTGAFYVDLGGVYTVDSMRVWNYNEVNAAFPPEQFLARGVATADIGVGTTFGTWSTQSANQAFDRAPTDGGSTDFSQTIGLGGVETRFIRIDIQSNHGDGGFTGLSELQFDGTLVSAAPQALPVAGASASSQFGGREAIHAANGNGLLFGSVHTIDPTGNMWLTSGGGNPADQADITFDLGSLQDIGHLNFFNYNETLPGRPDLLNRGIQQADILTSINGIDFSPVASDRVFAKAPGDGLVPFAERVDVNAVARFVRVDIDSNYGDSFTGVSEVQFFAPPEPTRSATSVRLGSVDVISGPGDLDLEGDIVYAVNFSANDPPRTVNGVTFTPDTQAIPGATFVGPNSVAPWQTKPDFGDTADDNELEEIYQDIRWANAGANQSLEAHLDVVEGEAYKLQLLISGNHQESRIWDIEIEGVPAVDEMTSLGVNPTSGVPVSASHSGNTAVVYTHSFTATDDTLDIRMGDFFGGRAGGDRNPIWQGLTLERGVGTDLSVRQFASVDSIEAGSTRQNLFLAVAVSNRGPRPAEGVQVALDLTLPEGVRVAYSIPNGVGDRWLVGNLGVGQTRVLNIQLEVGPGAAAGTGVIVSEATVRPLSVPLTNLGDDTARVAVSIEAAPAGNDAGDAGSAFGQAVANAFPDDVGNEATRATVWGPNADPDGDGFPNFIEFALGSDPNNVASVPLTPVAMVDVGGQNHLELTFDRLVERAGFTYVVEISEDMQTWVGGFDFVRQTAANPGGAPAGYERVVYRSANPLAPGSTITIRVRVRLLRNRG